MLFGPFFNVWKKNCNNSYLGLDFQTHLLKDMCYKLRQWSLKDEGNGGDVIDVHDGSCKVYCFLEPHLRVSEFSLLSFQFTSGY